MSNPTVRPRAVRRVIAVLGAPHVGKGTVVRHLARSWRGSLATYELPVEGGAAQVLACALRHEGQSAEVWCVPGSIDPPWPLSIARASRVGVLVLDPQTVYAARQRTFVDLYLRSLDLRWHVIVGKHDILQGGRVETWDPVPDALREAPCLRYNGRARDAAAKVRRFFVEHAMFTDQGEGERELQRHLGSREFVGAVGLGGD